MAPANHNCVALSQTEYEMVEKVIDIRDLEDMSWPECTIYKVLHNIRKDNEEAYTPQLISIGPIHFGKQELNPMQEHKTRYFHFFWQRVSNGQAMNGYKSYLKEKEIKIRMCYAEKFPDMSADMFVETVLLDAVFIMELLLRHSSRKSDPSRHEHDYILKQAWLSKNITRDLILLENQIPFFVLKELYDTVVDPEDNQNEHASFLNLALEFLESYDTDQWSSSETKQVLDNRDRSNCPKHFTDLIRFFYLDEKRDGDNRDRSNCIVPIIMSCCKNKNKNLDILRITATRLKDSGVSFEKVDNGRLLDITFEKKPFLSYFLCLGCFRCFKHFKARLRIPQLKIGHTTECVLRNLIALEQCHYPKQPYICNYVSFVDSLINDRVDVELLVEKEVIVHELGSHKEVAALVNGLCKHVVMNSNRYHDTINELDDHYQSTWNHTMAALTLVYFRDAWRASSTVVGIMVLVFTTFNFVRMVLLLD